MTDLPADYWELERQLRDELETETEGILFEPLTQEGKEELRGMIHRMVKRRLDTLRIEPPIKVICDESNNSPEDIDNGVVNVHIVPTIQLTTVEYEVNDGGGLTPP
jgi:hypothetical protein